MEDKAKEKLKTRDILIEIDNLKKYTNNIACNIKSDKLESYVDLLNKNIIKLQTETENFYNEKFDKEINSDTTTKDTE